MVTIAKQIAERGFVHGDIKAENLLFDLQRMRVVFIDFGGAQAFKPLKRVLGTVGYMPPEYHEHGQCEADALNVFSIGALIHMLVFGYPPFSTVDQVITCQVETGRWQGVLSQELIHLLIWSLEKDPQVRLSLDDLLAHPWFQSLPAVPTVREELIGVKKQMEAFKRKEQMELRMQKRKRNEEAQSEDTKRKRGAELG